MGKMFWVFLCTILMASPLSAKELVTVTDQSDLMVKVSLKGDPPTMGKNKIKIQLLDSSGNAVTDAKVKVYYTMPPMKGMAPMNHKTKAKIEGDKYVAPLKITMKGEWNVTLKIQRKDKDSLKAKTGFTVE